MLDIPLQNALAKMHCLDGMSLLPFVILTHIHQNKLRILLKASARLFESQFPHVFPHLVYQS